MHLPLSNPSLPKPYSTNTIKRRTNWGPSSRKPSKYFASIGSSFRFPVARVYTDLENIPSR